MSFSYTVKKELCREILGGKDLCACRDGLFVFCRGIDYEQRTCTFSSGCPEVCVLLAEILIPLGFCEEEAGQRRIFVHHRLDDLAEYLYHELDFHSERELSAFLSGAFFACGSVSDPLKTYHLELVLNDRRLYEPLCEILTEKDIACHKTLRRGSTVLYVNDSESVEYALALFGAVNCSMDMMNIRIDKEYNNNSNRAYNCISANIDKTVIAAEKQIAAIRYLGAALEELPPELVELARLRLENPEMTFSELGEALTKPMSRSGVSHRMKRIIDAAEQMGMLDTHR